MNDVLTNEIIDKKHFALSLSWQRRWWPGRGSAPRMLMLLSAECCLRCLQRSKTVRAGLSQRLCRFICLRVAIFLRRLGRGVRLVCEDRVLRRFLRRRGRWFLVAQLSCRNIPVWTNGGLVVSTFDEIKSRHLAFKMERFQCVVSKD